MQMNYDKLQNLIDKHLDSIDQCLRPLINEILDEDPDVDDDTAFKKLFRKISIYIILSSGLGNPGSIVVSGLFCGIAMYLYILTIIFIILDSEIGTVRNFRVYFSFSVLQSYKDLFL